jgi:large subunit ribosomal protein L23
MDISDVLIRPILSEKSDRVREKNAVYLFHVYKKANKIQIQKAVESIFNVKVESVRTVVRKGKAKRIGIVKGSMPDRKRAYITLKEGFKLDIFEGA